MAVKIKTGEKTDIVIGAIAKGSIMIAPNMATTLCFAATDIKINPEILDSLLREEVEYSFNSMTVDGCQSTNDMVFIQNNGESGIIIDSTKDKYFDVFKEGLIFVLEEMAKKIILDGEGASKFIEIEILSARSRDEAKIIGLKIANSLLFKASIFGESVNWGRIASAIGSLNIKFNTGKVDLYINDYLIFHSGMEVTENMGPALLTMQNKNIKVKVDMNCGKVSSKIWTTDLTHDFVKASSHYRS